MRVPGYRHHKARDLTVVRLDGRDVYLGQYDSPASHQKYRRVIAEWLACKPTAQPPPEDEGCTVNEIVLRSLDTHKNYYVREDGSQTGELTNFVDALRPLKDLYGREPAAKFGPLKLKAIRQVMIREGLARTTINTRVRRLIQVFKWAVPEELAPPSAHHGLKSVSGLQRGRSSAKETEAVRPAPESAIDAIRAHVPRQIWAMKCKDRVVGIRGGQGGEMPKGDLRVADGDFPSLCGRRLPYTARKSRSIS